MRKRIFSMLLVVAMVLTGLPLGGLGSTTVYAAEEEQTGLLVTDCIDGDQFDSGGVTYSKYMTADLTKTRLAFKYVDSANEGGIPVTAENITITKKDSTSAEGVASVTVCEDNTDFCDFIFNEVGDYVVTYHGAEVNNTVTIHVDYPVIGFYKANQQSADNFIQNLTYVSGKETIFYVIPHLLEGMTKVEYHVELDGGNSSYIKVNGQAFSASATDTSGVKLAISDEAAENFGIKVVARVYYKDEEGQEKAEEGNREYYLDCVESQTGFVCAWPEWHEDTPYLADDPEYMKRNIGLTPKQTNVLYFGTRNVEGQLTDYTENLVIKTVDGTAANNVGTIGKHMVTVEEGDEETEQPKDGYYDV